jgi:anti-sigma factor RsiW
MRHLTAAEVLQFVDSTADYATMAFSTNHLAVCERCRREVEFQKSLSRSVRRLPLAETNAQFTEMVMKSILPSVQSRLAAKVLNNLGSVFGLIMVLSAGGIIYSVALNTRFTSENSSLAQPSTLQEMTKAIISRANEVAQALPLVSIGEALARLQSPVLWSSVVLVLLLAFDRVLARRAIRSFRKLRT